MKRQYINDKNIGYSKNHSYKEAVDLIYKLNVFTHKNRINPHIKYIGFIHNRNLMSLYESIFYHTKFMLPSTPLKTRIKAMVNSVTSYPKCICCGKELDSIFNKVCSAKCNTQYNYPLKNKSDEELKEIYLKMADTRRKNGTYIVSNDTRIKQSISAKNSMWKKKQTCLKRYGIENPGVLGAYSSKSATEYIKNFIQINGFSLDQCFFKCDNKKEFFQMVYNKNVDKHKYFSYDLVVFSSKESAQKKDMSEIIVVLEYNGPWHYNESIDKKLYNEPATPYKNSLTIKETIEKDKIKLNHINKYCSNILIYWEKEKLLEKYCSSTV